jgi:ABC-type nickel/cobalt efflux system permease component RcnA
MVGNRLPMRRRLKSTLLIILSQALLGALAVSWLIHMGLIAVNGSVNFVENNPFILWAEIAFMGLVLVFAGYLLWTHLQKLGERRSDDSRRDSDRG